MANHQLFSATMSDAMGGVPDILFALTKLTKLNLSYHALKLLPKNFEALTELSELNLSHNAQLESLCGELSLLKKLTGKHHRQSISMLSHR